jgi:hypothetical protein
LVVVVGPLKDLFFGEGRQLVDIARAAVLVQQLGQGAIARKVAESLAQSIIYAQPILQFGAENLAACPSRPFPRHFPMSIGPTKDLLHRQRTPPQSFHAAPTRAEERQPCHQAKLFQFARASAFKQERGIAEAKQRGRESIPVDLAG